jgi:hypothetical protein
MESEILAMNKSPDTKHLPLLDHVSQTCNSSEVPKKRQQDPRRKPGFSNSKKRELNRDKKRWNANSAKTPKPLDEISPLVSASFVY